MDFAAIFPIWQCPSTLKNTWGRHHYCYRLIYSYKKINSLLRDIYVFPEEMKIIIERYIYEIRYSEKIKEWYLITKFYSFHSVPSSYITPYKYSSLDGLLEDIKNKLQEGLNELPELLPYYKDKKYTLRLKMYVQKNINIPLLTFGRMVVQDWRCENIYY